MKITRLLVATSLTACCLARGDYADVLIAVGEHCDQKLAQGVHTETDESLLAFGIRVRESKAVTASAKSTPCLTKLAFALARSQR